MFDIFQGLKKGMFVYSIITIVLGIILTIFPYITMQMICYIIAIILLIKGVIHLLKYYSYDLFGCFYYDLFFGLILCTLSFFILLRTDIVIMIFPIIIGIYFSIDGIINIMKSFQLRKYDFDSWIYDLVLSVILLLLGMMMLFDPFKVAMTSIIFMGICLIYDGVLNLIILYRFVLLKKKIDYFND